MEDNANVSLTKFGVLAEVNAKVLQLNEKFLRQLFTDCKRESVGIGILVSTRAYVLPVRGCRLGFFDFLLNQGQQIPVELVGRAFLKLSIGLGHLLRDGTQNILRVYKVLLFHFCSFPFFQSIILFVIDKRTKKCGKQGTLYKTRKISY